MSERLQKVLAGLGLGSRREVEDWIRAGRVMLNGKIADLGDKVLTGARVSVDGQPIKIPVQHVNERSCMRVILYYKPEGEVCTRKDPEGRPTVFRKLPRLDESRWVSVGRLDINSSGLLLFTDDGELANRLMHPSYSVEREYAVRVLGEVDDTILAKLTQGVQLEDGPAKFESIRASGGEGANQWFQVVVNEGRNREVRRLWESQGLKVSRLIRVRYGQVQLPRSLRLGKWLELSEDRVKQLKIAVGLKQESKTKKGNPRHSRRMTSDSFV